MKLFYDYDFFARAQQSLKFTHNYWFYLDSVVDNIGLYTMPNLLKYDELPLSGDIEIFYQLMLKRAIFHWKFIPCLLNDLFKAYPLFDISFSVLEISIFDSWLDLPECIDELYNIILENQWDHVLIEPPEEHFDNAMIIPPLCVGFDVKSHFLYEKFVVEVSHVLKKVGLVEAATSINLDFIKDPNNPEHVIYLLNLKFFLSIPDLHNFIQYWINVTTIKIFKSDINIFFNHFAAIMRKNLLITNQMLAVNHFFNLSSDREASHTAFLKRSPENQKMSTDFNYVPGKKKRRFNSYEEWFVWMTDVPKATEYEGYDK